MKFGRNSWYTIAGLVALVGLIGYAPELGAQEERPSLVESNRVEAIQPTLETANDDHKKEGLLSIEQEQVKTLRPTLETAHDLNKAELLLPVEDDPVEPIYPTLEISHDLNKAELLLPVEDNRVETLQPTLEIANDTDKEDWPSPINDTQTYWLLLVEQLEYRNNEGSDSFNWEALGWVGGDYRRLWLKTEGDVGLVEDEGGEAEVQLLYGQLIAPFWDLQAGLRYDMLYGAGDDRGRAFAVIGVQGLAPYLFEVDASLFVSEDGDVSARLSAEYQLLLTQRLILQPDFEVNIAAQQVEDFGVGSGLNDIELSLRLRYEISRRFAPYVGISWTRKFGDTADFAREEGEEVDNFALVGGLRLLF
ncbi:MAG: copper resistance protein B [Coleofasciculaceae cyanobacterium]